MKPKTIAAWTGIFLIGIIPILLFLLFGAQNYSSISFAIGRAAGLAGMTFFALTLVLSTRAKWIERLFDGLDKVYPVHATVGATSLILLLLHPLLLVVKFIPSNTSLAATYLLPGGLISVDFGIFALLGMIVLLMMTLYGHFKYHVWKLSHRFLSILFILAVLHIFLVRGDVAVDYIFNGYYLYAALVSALGIGAILYSFVRTHYLGKRYIVEKVNPIGDCCEVILSPVDKDDCLSFKAGQFVFVEFKSKGVSDESHPFSIASPSGKCNIRIIAKNLGDYTSNLGRLRKGAKAYVEGPYGKFHSDDFSDEVWIAGGIGITPFLGLAKDMMDNGSEKSIDLYYSVKSKEEFTHLEELQAISAKKKNFRVIPWVTNERGYLNLDEISKMSSLKGKRYYLCGPEGLKMAIKEALYKKNVSAERIHDERFAFK